MIKVNGKEVKFDTFPNFETLIIKESLPEDINERTLIDLKYEDDRDLIKLLFVKEYINSLSGTTDETHLRMYHAPYGRMDRSENGSPFTLKYIANFINSMDFESVEIVEPHSDTTLQLINNSFPNYITKHLYREVFKSVNFNLYKDYVMFPDKGASMRYGDIIFPNILIGEKVRNFESGKIESLDIEGEVKEVPQKVLIMDDLSSYGGTFNMSAKKLKELGFKEIYLLVAHAENSIFKGQLFDNINKIFTTDSMLTEHIKEENGKFKKQLHVYKLEELL